VNLAQSPTHIPASGRLPVHRVMRWTLPSAQRVAISPGLITRTVSL
jgi:hypothetical protein